MDSLHKYLDYNLKRIKRFFVQLIRTLNRTQNPAKLFQKVKGTI